MINTDDFVKRLESIFDLYGLSSSSFADKISVQRSSLSHLLSGRNKPSLDLILKIIDVFPEVDLYWLVSGEGNFPKNNLVENSKIKEELKLSVPTLPFQKEENNNLKKEIELVKTISEKDQILTVDVKKNTDKKLERIVLFYTDGSFIEYLS